jgi:hypothetical protein
MKVVINRCYGGFGLSDQAVVRYAELKGINLVMEEYDGHAVSGSTFYVDGIKDDEHYFSYYDLSNDRTDPCLVQVVEELGDTANGFASDLQIVVIPDDVEFTVEEYDGMEWVAEVHRTWC